MRLLLKRLLVSNISKDQHLAPSFISRMASPDTELFTHEIHDEIFLRAVIHKNEENKRLGPWVQTRNYLEMPYKARLARGIRTLKEVAHFVRCIPFFDEERYKPLTEEVWSSPDIMLERNSGTEMDHALLMASMFRAVQHETDEDVKKYFRSTVNQKLQASKVSSQAYKKLLSNTLDAEVNIDEDEDDPDGESPTGKGEVEKSHPDEESKEEDLDDERTKKAGSDEGSEASPFNSDEDKEDQENLLEDIEQDKLIKSCDSESSDSNISLEEETKDKDGKKETEADLKERVFICIGKQKNKQKEGEKKNAVWVMTFSKDYKKVTFWDCCNHKEDVLENRIQPNEYQNLMGYLAPQ